MNWLKWILAYMFDCVHPHTTWPHRDRAGFTYVCCLDCGRELPYSLERMSVVTREELVATAKREMSPGVVPPPKIGAPVDVARQPFDSGISVKGTSARTIVTTRLAKWAILFAVVVWPGMEAAAQDLGLLVVKHAALAPTPERSTGRHEKDLPKALLLHAQPQSRLLLQRRASDPVDVGERKARLPWRCSQL
jgi:hypothetical protein